MKPICKEGDETVMDEKRKVVIIGGGITGLTAAYYLQKEAREKGLPLDVKIIEASHRLGGKMQTVVRDGYIIERGPDSFLARKQSARRLAKEVGMEDKLVNNSTGKSFVLAKIGCILCLAVLLWGYQPKLPRLLQLACFLP